jgi:hypothetical protein
MSVGAGLAVLLPNPGSASHARRLRPPTPRRPRVTTCPRKGTGPTRRSTAAHANSKTGPKRPAHRRRVKVRPRGMWRGGAHGRTERRAATPSSRGPSRRTTARVELYPRICLEVDGHDAARDRSAPGGRSSRCHCATASAAAHPAPRPRAGPGGRRGHRAHVNAAARPHAGHATECRGEQAGPALARAEHVGHRPQVRASWPSSMRVAAAQAMPSSSYPASLLERGVERLRRRDVDRRERVAAVPPLHRRAGARPPLG